MMFPLNLPEVQINECNINTCFSMYAVFAARSTLPPKGQSCTFESVHSVA